MESPDEKTDPIDPGRQGSIGFLDVPARILPRSATGTVAGKAAAFGSAVASPTTTARIPPPINAPSSARRLERLLGTPTTSGRGSPSTSTVGASWGWPTRDR